MSVCSLVVGRTDKLLQVLAVEVCTCMLCECLLRVRRCELRLPLSPLLAHYSPR